MPDTLKRQIYTLLEENQITTESQELVCHIILLVIAILFSWLTGLFCRRIIAPLLLKIVKKTDTLWDDYLLNAKLIRHSCRVIPGIVFYFLLPFCLPPNNELFSLIVEQGSKIYIVITIVSLITVFLDNVEVFTKEEEKLKERHLYGIIEFLKIAIYFVAGIIIVSLLLGQSPFNMIAGIGAAATVLMLVFKDSILGLVAGIQLSVNRMIKPGDWITIKKSNIDGVVEKVSLTTVKVRNFDNTIYTVPPYSLISDTFQNWSSIYTGGGRRLKRAINIDMNSITSCDLIQIQRLVDKKFLTEEEAKAARGKINLTLYRDYIQKYIKSRPYVLAERTVLARHLDPSANGLPLEFYFFLNVTEFIQYESLCAECLEYCIATLPDFGLRVFQSPTGKDIEQLRN